ncbi:MAG: sugar ABC transporter substrate-binding protein [Homoserinimonas sp.]
MKKSSALVAATATLALALTGCSAADAGPGSSDDKGSVAMSFGGLDIQIWVDMLSYMEPIIEDAGYELITDDPKWDIQTQVSDWETWIVRGDVKAIMGYPVQSDSMVAVTQQAQDAGIPVVGYASEWEGTSNSVVLDNFADGKMLGEEAVAWMEETYGTSAEIPVALLGYWDTDLGRERSEGIREALDESGLNLDISEIPVVSLDDGYAAVQNQLTAVPDTKVWLAMASDPALGAYRALIDAGVDPEDPEVILASHDATNEVLDINKNADSFYRLSYILPAEELGRACAEMLIAAAEGNLSGNSTVEPTRVTPENADEFYTN